jgi:uncharacterized protein (DUF58 family)
VSAKTVMVWGLMLFAVGLLFHSRGTTVGGAYLAVAAGLSIAYSRASLKRLKYRREFSSRKAAVGDEVSISIGIENLKPLPVLWLKCEDEVPSAETLGRLPATPHYKPGRAVLTNVVYLRWFERVERKFRVKCLTRGVFRFGPITMSSGDIMGLKETSIEVADHDTLTVYPRMARVVGMSWGERFPLGDSRDRGWLYPDPLNIVGTRPYTAGTPIRQMAWRATAKTGSFQERLLQPTVQSSIIVALSLSTGEHYWEGVNPDNLETAIFVCASLCREFAKRGAPFGLFCNSLSASPSRGRGLLVAPGLSSGHFQKVLGILSTLRMPWMEFHVALKGLSRSVAPDIGLLAIMPKQLEADWEQLLSIAGTGRVTTAVVLTRDERFASYYRKIPTYLVSPPVDWRTSEVIGFARLA